MKPRYTPKPARTGKDRRLAAFMAAVMCDQTPEQRGITARTNGLSEDEVARMASERTIK